MYRVRTSWSVPTSQLGAFDSLANAKAVADKHPGSFVFSEQGIAVYPVPYYIAPNTPIAIYDYPNPGNHSIGMANPASYTILKVTNGYGQLKSGAGWVKLKDLAIKFIDTKDDKKSTAATPVPAKPALSPLKICQNTFGKVYDKVVELKCEHGGTAKTYEDMQQQRKTTCNKTACFALQEAGILKKGTFISHTAPVGGDAKHVLTIKKNLEKSVSGYKNLDLSKCDCVYLGVKNLGAVPAAFKVPGAVFIQDSNAFTYAGKINGKETNRSCNNAKNSQVKKDAKGVWRYFNNTVTSGYTFNQPILAVILPRG